MHREAVRRQSERAAAPAPASAPTPAAARVLALHHTIGNRATARLIADASPRQLVQRDEDTTDGGGGRFFGSAMDSVVEAVDSAVAGATAAATPSAAGGGTPLDLCMSSPVPSGGAGPLGGPNVGTHNGGDPPCKSAVDWFNKCGMDMGSKAGAEVRAAFDGKVVGIHPAKSDTCSSTSHYGAEVLIRSNDDKVGAYYTHIKIDPVLKNPQPVFRGTTVLGTVIGCGPKGGDGGGTHLHWALKENLPGGNVIGVDSLYPFFSANLGTSTATPVRFFQSGAQPAAQSGSC